jgi:hypothetical protein
MLTGVVRATTPTSVLIEFRLLQNVTARFTGERDHCEEDSV